MMANELLRLENISKRFVGVNALTDVSFDVRRGEVHGICGENGAGKSTLIKVISGAYHPDAGVIYFEGRRVALTPRQAIDLGIQTIYQEQNNFTHLNVVENIFTGLEISNHGFLRKEQMIQRTRDVLKELNCDFGPQTLLSDLSSGEQKLVEIAKALVFQRKVIILDEPTASLSRSETEHLLHIIRAIKETGIAIIYISHHLEEVFQIADRVTVLRDGFKTNTYPIAELTEQRLIRDMVGRDASAFYSREFLEPGEVVLEVNGVSGNGVTDCSFMLRRGEILGFSGMVGSGRSELMHLVFGSAPLTAGEIRVFGRKVNLRSPEAAIRNKMCFITEDRQGTGLFLQRSIAQNVIIASLVNRKRRIRMPSEDAADGEAAIAKLGVKARSSAIPVGNLSGGNQQKVVLGKWFLTAGEIFIFDEPTRGIDVGAKQEIYAIMLKLLRENKAIIMVSSDMPEVVSMSDRVMVMRSGRIVSELARADVSEENILTQSIGGVLT